METAMESSSPESDNSWVIAGSEGCLPVETLGPESETVPQTSTDKLPGTLDGEASAETKTPIVQPDPSQTEETDVKLSLESNEKSVDLPSLHEKQTHGELPEVTEGAGLESDILDQGNLSSPKNGPWSPKADQVAEELNCSSSDDDIDVEGLRRRRGWEARAPQPPASLGVHEQTSSEGGSGELGLSLNTCLLGALVLVGFGFLFFSGGFSDLETGPADNLEPQITPEFEHQNTDDIQDGLRHEQQAHSPPGNLPNLQSMSLLLDKLAKENQDIRLLQAQLQTQKEELQNLLHRHPGLEEENEKLRGALQQREASQQVLESEMKELRGRLVELEESYSRGVDGTCSGQSEGKHLQDPDPRQAEPKGFLEQKERLEAEAQMLRKELEKQRLLLSSVKRDLEKSLHESGLGDRDRADLAELGRRLAVELQGEKTWGPGEGRSSRGPANISESWGQGRTHFMSPREPGQKEKWKDRQGDQKTEKWKRKKEEFNVERKKSFKGKGNEESVERSWKEERPGTAEFGSKNGREWRGGKEHHKKNWGGPRGGEVPHQSWDKQKQTPQREGNPSFYDPQLAWKKVLDHKYRVPQGCSGITQCAHQEGLSMFGVELPPVRKQELASLLQKYLAHLPWGRHLPEPMSLLSTYFGDDGIFRHDRFRFWDFVEAMEDSLEEAAVRETGDDDEVDDFEDFIFGHFFGDKALRKRSGKKDKYQKGPKTSGPRNYREN